MPLQLPSDLLTEIFTFLDNQSLKNVACVSKSWRYLSGGGNRNIMKLRAETYIKTFFSQRSIPLPTVIPDPITNARKLLATASNHTASERIIRSINKTTALEVQEAIGRSFLNEIDRKMILSAVGGILLVQLFMQMHYPDRFDDMQSFILHTLWISLRYLAPIVGVAYGLQFAVRWLDKFSIVPDEFRQELHERVAEITNSEDSQSDIQKPDPLITIPLPSTKLCPR